MAQDVTRMLIRCQIWFRAMRRLRAGVKPPALVFVWLRAMRRLPPANMYIAKHFRHKDYIVA